MVNKWPSGVESGRESTFNHERANKWTDSIIPTQDMTVQVLSGAGSQRTTEQLSSSVLYMFVSCQDCHIVSGTSSVSATTGSAFWPGFLPYYFIPLSGNQYVAAINVDPTATLFATVAVAENPE